MTREDAERLAETYNNRDPYPDPGHRLVAVESPRTLLGEPKFGGWYCRREKVKTAPVEGGAWPFDEE